MSDRIICPMTLADTTTAVHECVPECALLVEVTSGPHVCKMCAVTALALAANMANGMCASPINCQCEEARS